MYPGHWAKVSPEKPALINAATGDVLTFRELNDPVDISSRRCCGSAGCGAAITSRS